MPCLRRDGFSTYWTSFGQGPRDALMIHCALAHSGSWGPLAGVLSGAMTMTAFDMPGHGRSEDWDDRGEYQSVVVEIAADFLRKPTDIVAHSFGATAALRLALEHPKLVRSLVLIEPVFFAVAFQDQPALRGAFEKETRPFVQAMEAGDTRTAAEEFTSFWGDHTPLNVMSADQQAKLAEQMHLVAAGQAALYDDVAGMLESGKIERMDKPTLLIEGSRSPRIISAIHNGLAARMPHATRAIIGGARHMAPITHSDQVGAEILRFYRRN